MQLSQQRDIQHIRTEHFNFISVKALFPLDVAHHIIDYIKPTLHPMLKLTQCHFPELFNAQQTREWKKTHDYHYKIIHIQA